MKVVIIEGILVGSPEEAVSLPIRNLFIIYFN